LLGFSGFFLAIDASTVTQPNSQFKENSGDSKSQPTPNGLGSSASLFGTAEVKRLPSKSIVLSENLPERTTAEDHSTDRPHS